MKVVKDLVPDMTNFYAQHRSIEPWLKTDTPAPPKEWKQSREDREKLDGLRASSAPAARPHAELLVELRSLPRPSRAATGLPLGERRPDEATGERLDDLEDPFRLYRCHTILNCTKACPRVCRPAKAIAELKKLMVERRV